jgi:hypothetical protein
MLNKDVFVMVAMKAYDKPSCKTMVEFEEDLAKFSNLVRLFSKEPNPIETHLMLNAVLIMLNIFDPSECVKLMFFKVKKQDWSKLKTILVYINRMPDQIFELALSNSEIEICQPMMDILIKI